MTLRLDLAQLKDMPTQEAFKRLSEYINNSNILAGEFKHFEVKFPGADPAYKFTHNLGFTPKDIIITSISGNGVLTFNVDESNNKTITLTVSGSCTARFLLGTYEKKS